jgi:hypothetical protein
MPDYLFSGIVPFELPLNDSAYLLILHADKQPVHLTLVVEKLFYSLTYKNCDTDLPIEKILKMIHIKKIPCLWIKLKQPTIPLKAEGVSEMFKQFPPLQANQTCLNPIWELLKLHYKIPQGKPLVFGLLDSLKKHQLIEQISSSYLPNSESGNFSMKRYDIDVVEDRILKLQKQSNFRKNV